MKAVLRQKKDYMNKSLEAFLRGYYRFNVSYEYLGLEIERSYRSYNRANREFEERCKKNYRYLEFSGQHIFKGERIFAVNIQ